MTNDNCRAVPQSLDDGREIIGKVTEVEIGRSRASTNPSRLHAGNREAVRCQRGAEWLQVACASSN
jgi:hypothetical protein